MKQYLFKSKGEAPDMPFTLHDLRPLRQRRNYPMFQLCRLMNERDYTASEPLSLEDRRALYRKPESRQADFFTVGETGLVVIPAGRLYPTLLRAGDHL